jgi:hypothetical protein
MLVIAAVCDHKLASKAISAADALVSDTPSDDEDLLFIELRNDYQDLMIFWEAYIFVETIAKLHNIKVYHTIAGYYYDVFKELESYLKSTINPNTFFEPINCYKNDGLARDCEHPGENWHIKFADSFYEFVKKI